MSLPPLAASNNIHQGGLKFIASSVYNAVKKERSLVALSGTFRSFSTTRSFQFSWNPSVKDSSQQDTYRTAAGVLKKVELRNNAFKTTFVTKNAIGSTIYTPQQRSWSIGSPLKSKNISDRLSAS